MPIYVFIFGFWMRTSLFLLIIDGSKRKEKRTGNQLLLSLEQSITKEIEEEEEEEE